MVEILKLLRDRNDVTIYAGGTDLMVTKRFKDSVVFINKIPELKEIKETSDALRIGACLTYSELIDSEMIPDIMKKVFSQVASPAIRNRGTIGGNVCNASPAGDTLPMLYALDAVVVLKSIDASDSINERRLPIKEFILGIRKIDRRPDELLYAIEIPKENLNKENYHYFEKVGARRSEAISKVSFFGIAKTENGVIKKIRVAFGAVGITVVAPEEVSKSIENTSITDFMSKKESILDEYMSYVKPIDDQRSTAEYRKTVVRNLLQDFMEHIA